MSRPLGTPDLRSLLWLIAAILLGLVALQVVTGRRAVEGAAALDAKFTLLSASVGLQLDHIAEFIRFTTDGVWIDMETGDSPTLGPTAAPVVITEFAD